MHLGMSMMLKINLSIAIPIDQQDNVRIMLYVVLMGF